MKRRVLVGAGIALLYVIGAAITSHLVPFGGGRLLDGTAPPPPYRWVTPPSDLASSNKRPFGGTFSLKFTGGRSEAGAFTTRDSQLSMVLDPGALPPQGNATSASISISPKGASSITPPTGYNVDGNVYQIAIKEEPSGSAVTSFVHPQRVILVYPADQSFIKPKHLLAISTDGKRWTRLKTLDSTVQQQSSSLIQTPGFVAVVTPINSKSSGSKVAVYVAVAVALLVIGGLAGWLFYRRSDRPRPRGR
jgi:hypothetical protein